MRYLLVAALAGCGSSTPPPRPVPPAPITLAPVESVAQPIAQPVATSSSRIVVVAGHLSGREPASGRALRHILAARKGKVELGLGFGQIDLSVTKVVSGTLDDPDYAARPIGVNTLPVVLLDEAAFGAADLPSLEGFEGTWKLTRMADGTLVVDAIRDTPLSASKVANRFAVREQARQDLHGSSPEQRFTGIQALGHHAFYELVPDVIALLDDEVIAPSAAQMLRQLAEPLADPATPQGRSRREWETYWHALLASRPEPPAIVAGTTIELATVEMNQSFPDLVAAGAGFVMGVTRLEHERLDGHVEGIAMMTAPWQQRTWLSSAAQDGLDAAVGPAGLGVLSSDQGMDATWHFAVGGTDRIVLDPKLHATHAAVAAWEHGFVLVYITQHAPALFAQKLDASGKPVGRAVRLPLPSQPTAQFHRGIHPVALARRAGGWLAVVETDNGVIAVRFDDALAGPQTAHLATEQQIVEPRAVGSFAVWKHRNQLASLVIGDRRSGGEAAPPLLTGVDVWNLSKPVALDDGYAIAWIEAAGEVHLGRFDANGARVADVVVHAHTAVRFSLALARDGDALLVAFMDETRYPFHIVARRIELAALK